MPSKSKAQANFMAAAAHNPEFAKDHDISQSVAQDFNKADAKSGNLKKSSKLPQHVKEEDLDETSETRDILDYLNNLELQDEIEQADNAVQYNHDHDVSQEHPDGCQCDDCHHEQHYYPDQQHASTCCCDACTGIYEDDEQEYDLQGKEVEPGQESAPVHAETSTERLQEMPQRFDAFAGQDRDEFVDKTAELSGKHNMKPFAEHDEYDVYQNKNGTGFIAYDKAGKQLAVVSGYISNDAVQGVPNVFVEEAIASKTGTKGIIYNMFMDIVNAGYKILSDELHSDDAINFWSKLISSHQVYVVGDGEVLAKATPEKLHKYWSEDEMSPSADLRLLLVK